MRSKDKIQKQYQNRINEMNQENYEIKLQHIMASHLTQSLILEILIDIRDELKRHRIGDKLP